MFAVRCSTALLSVLSLTVVSAPAARARPASAAASQPASAAASQPASAAASQPASAAASRPTSRPAPKGLAPKGLAPKGLAPKASRSPDVGPAVAQAEQLLAIGRTGEALALFEHAAQRAPERYGLLLKIAGCRERLGGPRNLRRARAAYARYLQKRPASKLRRRVEGRIARLDRRLRAPFSDEADPVEGTPVYKKWWFWTGLVAVVGGVVFGIVLAATLDDDVPSTSQPLRTSPLSISF